MNPKLLHSSYNSQQGSVLLEALIAFLIFSMGILGVIGLQATAVNNTLDARYRTDAAFLANQIIAQMWADASAVPATTPVSYAIQPTYACNPCTSANGNTKTQDWLRQIQGASGTPGFLPGETIGSTATTNRPSIVIGGASGTQVTVTMNWQSPQRQSPQNGALSHSYVTKTEIQFN